MLSRRDNSIGLIGSGLLYQAVRQQLEPDYHMQHMKIDDLLHHNCTCSLLLFIEDGWSPQTHAQVNHYGLKYALPTLQVYTEFGQGVIGPCVFPWESGCATCVQTRKITAMEEAADFACLYEHLQNNSKSLHQPWLPSFSREVLVHLVTEEVWTFFNAPSQMRTRNAVIHVHLDNAQPDIHHFLPDPRCPDCMHLPEDSAEAATITLQSRPKLAPSTYRTRSLTADLDALHACYVDKYTGMISKIERDNGNLYANAGAYLGLKRGEYAELGFGRTLSYGASQGAAVAEALERYAGTRPGGKKTTIRASYNQLGEQALDPATLGLHSSEQYALPDYPYVPYTPDLVCNWVWGYSFQRQQPLLVPEHYAYYGISDEESEGRSFVYEISNGCALGSCLEEAILYGILEIAERDAFLMTWYARLRCSRIDPLSAQDYTLRLLIERIKYITGYTVHAFNITLEQGIPCFWVMAVDEEHRSGQPRVLCAAGSHLHPEKALANAIHELAPLTKTMVTRYQNERERALKMFHDSSRVEQMDDHQLLYCLPEASERLHFLYSSPQSQTFAEAFSDFYARPGLVDLCEDLKAVIASYLATGLDIIVVDQTTPEHIVGQFRCVKVIIPGTLPMSFGHSARRISGFKRLHHLPYQLGYSTHPLTQAEINPYPHPFP